MSNERNPAPFSVGEEVTWTSGAGGGVKTKRGRVVAEVAEGESPTDALKKTGLDITGCSDGMHDSQDIASYYRTGEEPAIWRIPHHPSYIVLAPAVGPFPPRLYWPRVSALRRVGEAQR